MDNIRKYPRTLEEAFGPYQRHGLVEKAEPPTTADKITLLVSAAALIAVVVFTLLEWIK